MSLKSFDELAENVVLAALALDYVRMAGGIVGSLQVIDVQHTIAILVDNLVRLCHGIDSGLVHVASDKVEELIVAHSSVFVGVKHLKQSGHVFFADTHFEIFACLVELPHGQGTAFVIVHYFEDSLEANHASCPSGLQFILEQLQQGLWSIAACLFLDHLLPLLLLDIWIVSYIRIVNRLGRVGLLAEDVGELLEIKPAVARLVVEVEYLLQILHYRSVSNRTYEVAHHHSNLLDGTTKLIEIHHALVLNVKVLELLADELGVIDIARVLLINFLSQLRIEPAGLG